MLWLCAGCCADTFEIDADRSHQPRAQLVVGSATFDGELVTTTTPSGFDTTLVATDRVFTLHVIRSPSTTIDATPVPLAVTITTDITPARVCLADDQPDYGTGRCDFSYVGTIDITGDATGTWTLDQIAVVAPGEPDC